MDYGAGFTIGLACGMGCGIACGIGPGRSQGQHDMQTRIAQRIESDGLRILDGEGREIAAAELLGTGLDGAACAPRRKALLVLALITGMLVIATIAAWVFFATRG